MYFNYRGIYWETITNIETNTLQKRENEIFIECIRDSYLYQHIKEPTRQRGGDKPSVLDLIFTNEENTVTDIEICAPIGASDHSVINFNLNCKAPEQPPVIKTVYDKGDYMKMKTEFDKINF